MNRTDHATLIARGRKAGLSTHEIYAALSSRPPEGQDAPLGEGDGNGYAAEMDEQGHRVYKPIHDER